MFFPQFISRGGCRCAVVLAYGLTALLCPGQEGNDREAAQTRAAQEGISILPSRTDPEIKTFDSPHMIYADRDILVRKEAGKPPARGELLLWMTGTNGGSRGAAEFCKLAAGQGYHVVNLMYPNDVPASICRRSPDPKAFEQFRMAIIRGGSGLRIQVSRADSIENRLVKLLETLGKMRGREGWAQFLKEDGSPAWEKMVLAGQSQGGGHAFLLAMKHKVARVIATGAPKDWSLVTDSPAAWLSGESATPKNRYFTFNHEQDHQGCSPAQQWRTLAEFGLAELGPVTSVDAGQPPYGHSRILSTNHPGGKQASMDAHVTVIASRNAELFRPVWLYLLTEPVE